MLRVSGPDPYLVNIELQSYHNFGLMRTLWFRQVALDYRHELPVLTVLLLLCKAANSPGLTGVYERQLPDGWQTNRYNYRVVRLWQEDPELYLTAGVNLVHLAPLTNVAENELPALVRRMDARISSEPRPRAAKLWTAAYLLMGLSYPKDVVSRVLEGVIDMHQSTTYQAILEEGLQKGLEQGLEQGLQKGLEKGLEQGLEQGLQKGFEEGRIEGRVAGEQQLLVRQGTKKFGTPDAAILAAIEAIRDPERLEALGERIVDPNVRVWNSLIAAD